MLLLAINDISVFLDKNKHYNLDRSFYTSYITIKMETSDHKKRGDTEKPNE
jgi:hypothetical protein